MDSIPNDGELLTRFALAGEEAPFQELMQRHGRMVFQVCFRVLANAADAEDAAQAVFLTLAQKAKERPLQRIVSLGGWLQRLAWHVAMRLREASLARRRREQEVAVMNRDERGSAAVETEEWKRVRPLLDAVLAGLPEKYRLPFVLCELEGRTRDEAAALLGAPKRTVAGRLERARELLRRGLARHGVTLSVGALAGLTTGLAESVELPVTFVAATAKTASLLFTGKLAAGSLISGQTAALMQQASKLLFWGKVKTVAAAVVVAGLLTVTGATSYVAMASRVKTSATAPVLANPVAGMSGSQLHPAAEKETSGALGKTPEPAAKKVVVTPRDAFATDLISELAERGIQVLWLGPWNYAGWARKVSIPPELRFKPREAHELVEALAAANKRRVTWFKDGTLAILHRGESEEELQRGALDLESADEKVRRDAVWRIGHMPDPRAVPLLFGALHHADSEVARLAQVGLRRVGWTVAIALEPRALEALKAELFSKRQGWSGAGRSAIYALAEIDPEIALPLLEEEARSETTYLRNGLPRALVYMRSERALPLLEKALNNDQYMNEAIAGLAHLRSERAVMLLERALAKAKGEQGVTIVRALGKIGTEPAVARLKALQVGNNLELRIAAAVQLGKRDGVTAAWLDSRLKDADECKRCAAVELLADVEAAYALSRLKELSADSSERVRETMARTLGEIGGDEAVTLLDAMLNEAKATTKLKSVVCSGLGKTGGERATALLARAANDKDKAVRQSAILGLRAADCETAVQALGPLLTDNDPIVRSAAADALAQMGGRTALEFLEKELQQGEYHRQKPVMDAMSLLATHEDAAGLVERALKSKSAEARQRAMYAVPELRPDRALPLMIDALTDANYTVRMSACNRLAEIDGEQAIKWLNDALGDADRWVRYEAARGLGGIAGTEARARLMRAWQSRDAAIRAAAVSGISYLDDETALPVIEKALDDSDANVRGSATSALDTVRGPQIETLLMKALGDKDPEVRGVALHAMGQLSAARRAVLIDIALSDPDRTVRASALVAAMDVGPDYILPLAEKAMRDSDAYVRLHVPDALYTLSPRCRETGNKEKNDQDARRAVELLEVLLAEKSDRMRQQVVRELASFPGEHARRLLEKCISDPAKSVRLNAADSLRKQSGEAALPLLEKMVDDAEGDVRGSVASAISEFGTERARDILIAMLAKEHDVKAQQSIVYALKKRYANMPAVVEALKNMPKLANPKAEAVKPPKAPAGDNF